MLIDKKLMFRVDKVPEDTQLPIREYDDKATGKWHYGTYAEEGYTGLTEQDPNDKNLIWLHVVDPSEYFYQGLKDVHGNPLPTSPMWLSIYHEIGHGLFRWVLGAFSQAGLTIDFENFIRGIKGEPGPRAYDDAHPKYGPPLH
jgi:hypothetical protein